VRGGRIQIETDSVNRDQERVVAIAAVIVILLNKIVKEDGQAMILQREGEGVKEGRRQWRW
jgi:hypothetical protein